MELLQRMIAKRKKKEGVIILPLLGAPIPHFSHQAFEIFPAISIPNSDLIPRRTNVVVIIITTNEDDIEK